MTPPLPPLSDAALATPQVTDLPRNVRSVSSRGERGGCSHRYPILLRPARLSWPDGEDVGSPLRVVTCAVCQKRWVLDLTRRQRLRLISYRRPHDRRSPYEIAPEVLRED